MNIFIFFISIDKEDKEDKEANLLEAFFLCVFKTFNL